MTQIRKLRIAAGMSMKELGRRIGKSESSVCLYETGVREPPVRVARLIARALGCTWEELYEDTLHGS